MMLSYCFFFNDTATTEIYTLSLHDALPICSPQRLEGAAMWFRRDAVLVGSVLLAVGVFVFAVVTTLGPGETVGPDRKSTRLNSSHANISYAAFCLKKKHHIKTAQLSRPRDI